MARSMAGPLAVALVMAAMFSRAVATPSSCVSDDADAEALGACSQPSPTDDVVHVAPLLQTNKLLDRVEGTDLSVEQPNHETRADNEPEDEINDDGFIPPFVEVEDDSVVQEAMLLQDFADDGDAAPQTQANGQAYVPGEPGAKWTTAEVEELQKRLWKMFENHRGKRFDSSPGAARVLRLGFHGCLLYADGTGGCDGCIDWEGIDFRFDPRARKSEKYRVPLQDTNGNAGLEATVKSLESFYNAKWFNKKTESLRDMGKSRADLWALAAIEAVRFSIDVNNKACNGDANIGNWKVVCLQAAAAGNLTECMTTLSRDIVFKSGRRDCASSDVSASYKSPKRNRFPKVSFNGPALTDWFKNDFGLNGRETVSLMGAHTIGGLHPPVSGLFYSFTSHQEDAFNNQYYRNMVSHDDWFFEDNKCTQRGTSTHARGQARWRVKASAAFLNKAPVEWIQEKLICYNCDWAKTNRFPATFTWWGRKSTRKACNNVDDTKVCIPGTEAWRFNWGRDDAGTQADLAMLLDFKVDEEGFPYGCTKLDPYENKKGGYYDLKNGRSNKLVAAECGPQMHEEPPTSDGSNALSKIVNEFAYNKQAWLDTFVPTFEKMLANGYTDSELHLPEP